MLVNIIHPYTFKLVGDTFQIGPVPEFEERDRNLAALVAETLAANCHVLVHRDNNGTPLTSALQEVAFSVDPLFSFLFDSRVESVVTTHHGLPIPDKKPDSVPTKTWTAIKQAYTAHSALQQKIGQPRAVFFVGGMLENCIANAACYFHRHYRTYDQQLFYIKELCVSQDASLLEKVLPQFDERGIHAISYQEAMKRVKDTTPRGEMVRSGSVPNLPLPPCELKR